MQDPCLNSEQFDYDPSEYCGLACGDDETVVFDPDGFNLRRELEFVSISRRVEQLMDDTVEGRGWNRKRAKFAGSGLQPNVAPIGCESAIEL